MSTARTLALLAVAVAAGPSGRADGADPVGDTLPRMPRGVDVSPADQQVYAAVAAQRSYRSARVEPEAPASSQAAAGAPLDDGSCALLRAGASAVSTQGCLRCHAQRDHSSHPVDLDYGRLSGRSAALRPAEEVVRRGLLLPDGKLHCVTCHDGLSRFKSHLVVPPGSEIQLAVDRSDPTTFEAPRIAWADRTRLPPGTDVARRALCTACHAMD